MLIAESYNTLILRLTFITNEQQYTISIEIVNVHFPLDVKKNQFLF